MMCYSSLDIVFQATPDPSRFIELPERSSNWSYLECGLQQSKALKILIEMEELRYGQNSQKLTSWHLQRQHLNSRVTFKYQQV